MRLLLLVTSAALCLVLCAACVSADAVIVKPSAMNGWVQGVDGPLVADVMLRDPAPPNRTDSLVEHTGSGAWYFYTGAAESTDPAQGNGWIGTNQFAGVRLDKITNLSYLTWTDDSGLWMNREGAGTYLGRQLNAPRQPVHVEMLVDTDPNNAGDPTQQIYIMHRPIGTKNLGMPGSGCERTLPGWPYRMWAERSLANDVWVVWIPTTTPSIWDWQAGPRADGCWYWADILAQWPDAAIAASAVQDNMWPGGSWPSFSTVTGCSLNFTAGARHFSAMSGMDPNHPLPNAWTVWWRDAQAMRYWLDDFTIAIDGDEGVVETTFDFEADAPGPEVCLTTKSARGREACGVGPIMTRDLARGYVRYIEYGARYNTFVLTGMVAEPDGEGYFGVGSKSFYIDDGFKKTEVFCPDAGFYAGILSGQYVRVKGMLQIDYGQFLSTDTSNEFTAGDPEPNILFSPETPNIHPRLLAGIDDITILFDPYQ